MSDSSSEDEDNPLRHAILRDPVHDELMEQLTAMNLRLIQITDGMRILQQSVTRIETSLQVLNGDQERLARAIELVQHAVSNVQTRGPENGLHFAPNHNL